MGYVLFALAASGVVLGLLFLRLAIAGPADRRSLAWTFTFMNAGFATANVVLGFVLIRWSGRRGGS